MEHVVRILRVHAHYVCGMEYCHIVFVGLCAGKSRHIHLVGLKDFHKARVVSGLLNAALDSPPEEPVCYTMSYFREASDTAPLQGYGCYITPTILNIYKEIPVATSAASSTTNTAYLAPVSSPSTSSATNGLSQSSLTSFQSTAVSQPSTTASTQSSSAWIAGPVVGAFAGGAIFIGVAFWIWHLHRRLAQSQRDLRATEVGTDKPPQGQQLPQIWPPTSAPKPQELASYHVVEAPRNELRAELPPR